MRRDPFTHWLLTMVTFGQYAFLWGFRLAGDANALVGGGVFEVKKHARAFLIAYVIYILAFFGFTTVAWNEPSISLLFDSVFWCVYAFAIGLTCYFLWVLVRVAQMLRKISGQDVPRSITVVLFFFLWALSLPLLQKHLNKLVKKEPNSERSAAPSEPE